MKVYSVLSRRHNTAGMNTSTIFRGMFSSYDDALKSVDWGETIPLDSSDDVNSCLYIEDDNSKVYSFLVKENDPWFGYHNYDVVIIEKEL